MSNLKSLYKQNKKRLTEDVDLGFMIDKFMMEQHLRQRERRTTMFHPSIISKGIPCERWWYFMLTEREGKSELEAFNKKALRAMLIGTAIHDAFHKLFYEMGILEGMWKCQNCDTKFWGISPQSCKNCMTHLHWNKIKFLEIPYESEFVMGHADGILHINKERYLLELKSIKNDETKKSHYKYGFEHLVGAMEDHELQAQIYMEEWAKKVRAAEVGYTVDINENSYKVSTVESPDMAAAKAIGPLNKALVFYVAKNTSEDAGFVVPRNELKVKFLYSSMAKIWTYVVTRNEEGAREELIALCDSEDCQKSCQFKDECK